MSNDEVEAILEEIIELARLLNWSTALAQDKNNHILGIYVGLEAWIDAKIGKDSNKITH